MMKNKSIVMIICMLLYGCTTLMNAQNQTPCKGYPNDDSCCKNNDGTWIVAGSAGFCYMSLGQEGLNSTDCIDAGGALVKMNDGSRFCVPKGVKTINGNIVFVNKKDKTILLVSNGTTYKFNTTDLPGILKTEEGADVFYTTDPNGSMKATAIRSAKSK